MVKESKLIDVSQLPVGGFDARAPLWWGNLLMLIIETVAFGILVASYFYLRMNYETWPPPRVNKDPILYNTNPDLGVAIVNTVLLIASCLPTFWIDRAARQKKQLSTQLGLMLCIIFGLISILLRFQEFSSIHFKWSDNAYASVVWTILGMHLLHLMVGTVEFIFLLSFATRCDLDDSHALDVSITAVYWYWVVGIWLVLFAIVYLVPRFI